MDSRTNRHEEPSHSHEEEEQEHDESHENEEQEHEHEEYEEHEHHHEEETPDLADHNDSPYKISLFPSESTIEKPVKKKKHGCQSHSHKKKSIKMVEYFVI